MKKQFIAGCITAFTFACLPFYAQVIDSTLKNTYEHKTILLDESNNKYVKDDEKKKIGFFGGKIGKEFDKVSDESKEAYKRYHKLRKLGMVWFIVGTTAVAAVVVVAPVLIPPAFLGTLCLGGSAEILGSIKLFRSRHHLQKAVWLLNRDVLVAR